MLEQRVNILVYRPDGTLIAQYLLGDGEHLIGRDINCPVYLDSEYISSNHAKLYLSHDGIQIEDLNSTSGTFLDSVTVRGKLRIKPGQVLQVGDLTVQLQPESEGQIGPGSRLGDGRYTLIRMLGRGGMGEVWLAKDEQLDEEVALKKLPPEVGADAMALADMRREVQKSRALSHPNIIRIHDLIQQAGEDPLISLEFVDGTDLTAIAATKTNGVFDWVAIKDWMLQLANALEYAHEEKIVHRDLKPGNIMISRTGRLKLADFGIAATVADSLSRSSMQGFVSGTTLYMSPQQMEGAAPKETDDVYAFGATIYELLTSRPPFYTGNVEHQVLQVTPTPPSQRLGEFGFVGQIPPHVQELVMACLAKVPEGRPQSMGAIRDWIQSDGKAEGAIPKPSTKTIKHAAPVAAGGEPGGVAPKSGSSGRATYVVGVVFIFICFIVGKKMAGGKSEELPKGDNNGSAAIIPASLKEGLVAYYPFNGNAEDESGNGHNGKLNGVTLTIDRHGDSNKAYSFDGMDDEILVDHKPELNAFPITISLWVKISEKHYSMILGKTYDGSSNGYILSVRRTGKVEPTFLHGLYSGIGGEMRKTAKGYEGPPETGDLSDGFWHQIIFSVNKREGVLYVDGRRIEVTPIARAGISKPTTEYPLRIGSYNSKRGVGNFFNGQIDDLRIYDRVLSEAEVKALYEFEKAG